MRIVSADGSSAGDSIADALADAQPTFAAVTRLSPSDACSIADALSLRYAVQCWDVPSEGKAIFWNPDIPLQGLYRAEFPPRERGGTGTPGPSGLLRVTLSWSGRPLNIICAQLAPAREDADWQLVLISRELQATHGPTLIAIAGDDAQAARWPGYTDAWSSALWRSIAYPEPFDVGDMARSAFGVTAPDPAFDASRWLGGGPVRVFCSRHLSVVRSCHRPWPSLLTRDGPLAVDLAMAAGSDRPAELIPSPPLPVS